MSLLPEDPEGRDKLVGEIERVVQLLGQIDGIKQDIKDIADEVEDMLNVKKATFSKLAKTKYKEDAEATRREAEEIEASLDILFAD